MAKMNSTMEFGQLRDYYKQAMSLARVLENLVGDLEEAEESQQRTQAAFDNVMSEYREKKDQDISMEERGRLYLSMGDATLALQRAIADCARLRTAVRKERDSLASLQKLIADYYTVEA